MAGVATAQNKDAPKSIISQDVGISKYHDRKELEQMQKGVLLGLYNERIEIIIKINMRMYILCPLLFHHVFPP